jgi:hypothetical protein
LQQPRGHRRVEDHHVPTYLQATHDLDELLDLEQSGVGRNGPRGDYQEPWHGFVPVVLEGFVPFQTAGEAHEVRLAEHPVQARVLEVAVDDGRPAAHAGERRAETEAQARAAGPWLRASDDDALDLFSQREKVVGKVLVVPPYGRVGVHQPPRPGALYGSKVQVSPPRYESSPV